jgi:hypothetical protein
MRHDIESCDQGGEDQDLAQWTGCKCEGQVGGFEARDRV